MSKLDRLRFEQPEYCKNITGASSWRVACCSSFPGSNPNCIQNFFASIVRDGQDQAKRREGRLGLV